MGGTVKSRFLFGGTSTLNVKSAEFRRCGAGRAA